MRNSLLKLALKTVNLTTKVTIGVDIEKDIVKPIVESDIVKEAKGTIKVGVDQINIELSKVNDNIIKGLKDLQKKEVNK